MGVRMGLPSLGADREAQVDRAVRRYAQALRDIIERCDDAEAGGRNAHAVIAGIHRVASQTLAGPEAGS